MVPVEVPSKESVLCMTLCQRCEGFVINDTVFGAYKKGLVIYPCQAT